MTDVPDDGYSGAAELLVENEVVPVTVTLTGHFEPITGSYSWYGRVAASPAVAELVAGGTRAVRLRTPQGTVETQLADIDPWGRPRVQGTGTPPFEVLASVES